ncbi:hypothetical protein OTA22_33 [Vibrio phage OTA22]|nr:hypothetical protein OTA22_33 [Vibrio phage OTA22]
MVSPKPLRSDPAAKQVCFCWLHYKTQTTKFVNPLINKKLKKPPEGGFMFTKIKIQS